MKKLTLLAQAIGVTLALGALPTAHGAAQIGYQVDGGAVVFCADNDITCDQDASVGVVEIDGLLGGVYDVTVIAGITKPEETDPLMDLAFLIQSESDGDHTLVFGFTDTDFAEGGTLSATIGGTINGAGNTIDALAFCDSANTAFGIGTNIATFGTFTTGAFSDSSGGVPACSTPYSASLFVLLSTTDTGLVSGDFALNRVPEPGTLALLGLGFAGFAAFRRRRQK